MYCILLSIYILYLVNVKIIIIMCHNKNLLTRFFECFRLSKCQIFTNHFHVMQNCKLYKILQNPEDR